MESDLMEGLTDFERWVWEHHSGTINVEVSAKEAWDYQQKKIDMLNEYIKDMKGLVDEVK